MTYKGGCLARLDVLPPPFPSPQLLFGHEIDRLVAWHNPLGAEERRLPSERQFSLDARLQALPGNEATASAAALGAAEWARTMSVAWAVDPALAVAVWQQRFRCVGHATAALSRLVLADPAAVRMLPAAVLIGATFLTVTDGLGRLVIYPLEIPVGIFTALVGAPFFLFLLRHRPTGIWS
jgi:hypothetical protein